MEKLIEKINHLLSSNYIVNEHIFGIYLLEKLKYLIINDLINIDKEIIENLSKEIDIVQNSSKKILENDSIIAYLNYYNDSISKIKSTYQHDSLSLVVAGFKIISIFHSDNKNSTSLFISKNTGIVLTKNTITSEKIGSGSIIIDIDSKKDSLNIEK